MEILCPLVIGEESTMIDFNRQIFKEKPHITFDNYFSGDGIMNWAGENGFSATMTCRRDRLPGGVANKYLHKESTQNGDKRARVGRFNNPITLVKTVTVPPVLAGVTDRKATSPASDVASVSDAAPLDTAPVTYTRVHVSFQSTSSTNISTVNALNANKRMVLPRERGQGAYKRKWVIEYNEARQLYLSSYGRIDTIDAAVKKCHMGYRSWKYWHNAKTHGYALVQVTAYDMYKECMTEPAALEAFGITPEDQKKHPLLSFHEFRERLATQGLQYNPLNNNYPGDSKMRAVTQQAKNKRARALFDEEPRRRGRPIKENRRAQEVTPEVFSLAKKNKLKSRLCGDLSHYAQHSQKLVLLSSKECKNGRKCEWCGEPCWTFCDKCPDKPFLHNNPLRGNNVGKICFLNYHNDSCFGLGKGDASMFGIKKSDWRPATPKLMREQTVVINKIKETLDTEG